MNVDYFSLWFSLKFIKILSTPWKEQDAFKFGIIDAKGNILRKWSTLRTSEERAAFTKIHVLAWNIKKILDRFAPTSTKLGSFASALWLLREEYQDLNMSIFCSKLQASGLITEDDLGTTFSFGSMTAPIQSLDTTVKTGKTKQRLKTFHSIETIARNLGLDMEQTKKVYSQLVKDLRNYDEDTASKVAKSRIIQNPSLVKEDAPVNNVGGGGVAGTTPDSIGGPSSHFAGCPVFKVNSDIFRRCIKGKGRYHPYSKYFDVNEGIGKTIRHHGLKSRGKSVILQHESDGSMIYFKIGKK